jgi:Uma2 family endonuclease
MAPQTSTKLTYEDYLVLPDDGRRHEIIDGEHYVNPSPNTQHQRVLRRLAFAMSDHIEEHRLGELFFAPFDVVLTDFDVVEPDIIFLSNARAHILTDKNIQGVPDLLVEVLSSNRRYDKRVKYDAYERAALGEYWIVDPDDEVVEVYRHDGRRFARIEVTDTLSSPLLPGFHMNVHDLFV